MLRNLTLAFALACAALPAAAAPPLVVALGPAPDRGFDPLFGWGATGDLLFQSALWRRGADGAPVGELATGWELSADRLVWTFTLREDARFSDGTPLTAADVAFTFTTAAGGTGILDLRPFAGAEVVDDHTIRLHLSEPAISFSENFYTLGILPAAAYDSGYGQHPLGSGPYQLAQWRAGEQITLTANPFYFGEKPAFAQITFLLSDATGGLMAARARAAHLVHLPLTSADVTVPQMHVAAHRTVDNRGISLPVAPPDPTGARGNAVTADPAIRKALNLWLDRQVLVDVGLGGHGRAAFGPGDGLPWDGETALAHDPESAAAVLEDAGWTLGPDGIRAKDGIRAELSLYYPASDPTRQKLAELTAALTAPLGIAFTPRGATWEEIATRMARDPVLFGFGSQSGRQLAELFRSDLAGSGWFNPTHYTDAKVDALLAAAETAPSLPEAEALWRESFARFGLAGDNAWAWLVNIDHSYLVHDCLDLGPDRIEPHLHDWPVTAGIRDWRWTCD